MAEYNCPVCEGVGEIPANAPADPALQEFSPCSLCTGTGVTTSWDLQQYQEWLEATVFDQPAVAGMNSGTPPF